MAANNDPLEFGEVLKILRLNAGFSLQEFARRVGISRPNLSQIELGYHTTTLKTLGKIARALECRPSDILRCMEGDNHPGGRNA